MPQAAKIEITIDPSLLDHFRENLNRRNSSLSPEAAITRLVATILDNSAYPVKAKLAGETEIQLAYHLRSFSQPIFQ